VRAFRAIVRAWDCAGVAAALCLAALTLVPASFAQDVTFNKTRYSSVKQPKEADVIFTVADSKILIKGKKVNGINMEIPFSSIDSMSYERSARHRMGEGASVMLLSPATGAILMATKTKSHWLGIQYHEGDADAGEVVAAEGIGEEVGCECADRHHVGMREVDLDEDPVDQGEPQCHEDIETPQDDAVDPLLDGDGEHAEPVSSSRAPSRTDPARSPCNGWCPS